MWIETLGKVTASPMVAGGPLFHEMHNQINNFLVDDGHVATRKFDLDPGGYWPTAIPLMQMLDNPNW